MCLKELIFFEKFRLWDFSIFMAKHCHAKNKENLIMFPEKDAYGKTNKRDQFYRVPFGWTEGPITEKVYKIRLSPSKATALKLLATFMKMKYQLIWTWYQLD